MKLEKRLVTNQCTQEVDPKIFVDALLEVIALQTKNHACVALQALDLIITVASKFYGDMAKVSSLPLFEDLALRLCSCCFNEDTRVIRGGITGISHLMNALSAEWGRGHQVPFLKAVLHAIQEPDLAAQALNVFYHLIAGTHKDHLSEVTSFLTANLLCSSKFGRGAVIQAIITLADLNECSVAQLLSPATLDSWFLQQIGQPQPIEMQIAFADIIAFFLQQRPSVVPLSAPIIRKMEELLLMADDETNPVNVDPQLKIATLNMCTNEMVR